MSSVSNEGQSIYSCYFYVSILHSMCPFYILYVHSTYFYVSILHSMCPFYLFLCIHSTYFYVSISLFIYPGSNLRPMASILPTDASTTTPVRRKNLQRVRSTLDSIDRLGYVTDITIYGINPMSRLHLGVVLRRYPYVRLFTFAYIVSEVIR